MDKTAELGPWWGSLALVNAGLAQTKGRSRLNWFLLSLFLGPLATLFIVVWRPLTRTAPATNASTQQAASPGD
jgi:hypothetical protein